jgi:hypothetical protein
MDYRLLERFIGVSGVILMSALLTLYNRDVVIFFI